MEEKKVFKPQPIFVPLEEQKLYPDPENHRYACPQCGIYLRYEGNKKYRCKVCGYIYISEK